MDDIDELLSVICLFVFTGLAGFLWCCLFVFFARNSPAEMPGITQIERDYIEKSLGVYGQTAEERAASRVGYHFLF